nr:putative lectin [uncultured Mediterranean phage uvMED]
MTAFDNIKTNNWPSTSNELEDFLVLKLPLNDNASLTESLPVNAGSQELFPKRTLTNTGVQSVSIGNRIWSSAFVAESSSTLPFRDGKTIASAFGPANSIIETATNQTGEVIYLDFANNGGALTGYSTIKFLGGGLNAGNRGVFLNGSSTSAGALDVGIDISGQTINNIQVKSVASNAGAAFAGIELDGVRLIDPSYRKHYANSADFSSGHLDLENSLFTEDSSLTFGGGNFTIEAWVNVSDTTASNPLFAGQVDGGTAGGSSYIITLDTTNGRTPRIHVGGAVQAVSWGSAFSANTWYHVAMVRDGNTLRLYRDGVQSNSAACSGAVNTGSTTYKPSAGSMVFAGVRYTFQGQIQDLRIYKELCKYPGGTSFTPPSAILG